MALPIALYSTAQVRALDAHAIKGLGIPGYTLMKRAGEAALRYLRTRWPMAHRIVIVCGGGNNGGDGYVVARFAHAAGLAVTVLAAVPPSSFGAMRQLAYEDFKNSEGQIHAFDSALFSEGDVIVDALLGTGLRGGVREELGRVIREINSSGRPVFALDVPSGLDSDTGVATPARRFEQIALLRLSDSRPKPGLFIGDGPEHAGTVYFDDLEISAPPSAQFKPGLERIVDSEIKRALPRRPRGAHKGNFGQSAHCR